MGAKRYYYRLTRTGKDALLRWADGPDEGRPKVRPHSQRAIAARLRVSPATVNRAFAGETVNHRLYDKAVQLAGPEAVAMDEAMANKEGTDE